MFKPQDICNVDKLGGKIIARRGQKKVGKDTLVETGQFSKIFACVNAIVNTVLPLLISPGKQCPGILLKGGIPGAVMTGPENTSGWITASLSLPIMSNPSNSHPYM